tara:strand:- start:313 stop:786 length:474 start_codon:yes stop_codon:yes gene_type:complete
MVKKFLIPFLLIFSLSSCETTEENNKLIGQIIGAGVGALVGYQFGSGVGGALTIAGGTILGGLIGGEIAEMLSEDEQMEFGQVTEDALENKDMGETSNWTSSLSANTTGEVAVTQSFEVKQKQCKKIKQKIDKDGQTIVKVKSFCRGEDGNWTEFES